MNKLIVAGTLVAALAFPLASHAGVNAFGVQLPVGQYEASGSAKGGYVAQGLNDTFRVQTLSEKSGAVKPEETTHADVYTVFGIHLSGDDVI